MCDFLGMLLKFLHLDNDIGRLYWVIMRIANKLAFIKCFGSAR